MIPLWLAWGVIHRYDSEGDSASDVFGLALRGSYPRGVAEKVVWKLLKTKSGLAHGNERQGLLEWAGAAGLAARGDSRAMIAWASTKSITIKYYNYAQAVGGTCVATRAGRISAASNRLMCSAYSMSES